MPPFDFEPFSPQTFSGLARLFPLPNLVLFPHALQPLHIFEPRYRAMLAAAQRDDKLIAMTLLQESAAEACQGLPQIAQVVCLGRVVAATKLPDGRSNILLLGIQRAKIVAELETACPYRQATVELLEDEYPLTEAQRQLLQSEIMSAMDDWLPDVLRQDEQFRAIFDADLSLGTLCDIIANCLPIEVNLKQGLLAATDVEQRGLLLLDAIDTLDFEEGACESTDSHQPFPPDFSDN